MILLSAFCITNAQSKAFVDAAKAIDKAKEEAANPKKATNPATWIKLAKAYTDAYNLPSKNIWLGASNIEVKVILKAESVKSTENRVISDDFGNSETFVVDTYDDKELYYNSAGVLQVVKVTKWPYEGNLLDLAYDAYMKAFEVDPKGSKKKDLEIGLTELKNAYNEEAMAYYNLNDVKTASRLFESSLKTSENPVMNTIDSVIVYYTAVTANATGDVERAKKYYQRCIDIEFYSDGDAFGSLAELYKREGDVEKAKEILSEGFSKFPTSQTILISLINIYMETGDDPNKVLDLIHVAQKNEPTNASLYWAEGNVYKGLGDMEKAIEQYYKSFEINNNYIFGVFTVGATYYEKAIELQEKAIEELDDNKYNELMDEMSKCLKDAIEPFEKAFANTEDLELKSGIASYLKEIYFRFRDEKPEYMDRFNFFNEYIQNN